MSWSPREGRPGRFWGPPGVEIHPRLSPRGSSSATESSCKDGTDNREGHTAPSFLGCYLLKGATLGVASVQTFCQSTSSPFLWFWGHIP